jgi:hypothetical protein
MDMIMMESYQLEMESVRDGQLEMVFLRSVRDGQLEMVF